MFGAIQAGPDNTTLKRMLARAVWLALLLLVVPACNQELGPLNEPSGFSGVLRFRNWPPADSNYEMRLIVFDDVPTDSNFIISTLLAGKAAIWPPAGVDFPVMEDSLPYVFTTRSGTNLQVKTYNYLAVVWQYGPAKLHDWRPAGVYTAGAASASPPVPVHVILHKIVPNIDIMVDFHNLPPIPWRPGS